jgi:hypothetical protein
MEKKFAPNSGLKQQIKLDIKKTTPIVCDNEGCDSEVFMPAMKFRRVPKLLTGSKEDQILPAQIMMCVSCGNIPELFDLDTEE